MMLSIVKCGYFKIDTRPIVIALRAADAVEVIAKVWMMEAPVNELLLLCVPFEYHSMQNECSDWRR